ncbi:MAG TPA: aminotransferase class V-fold PLP-dependent enzyme, partial [Terriglobia bacterium]|nr:aminotransferase class V-fold PLP-dependent enzyme [Terriglobia bacterium]
YDDFRRKIGKRTRLVAMGWASNAFGTVNDVARVRQWTKEVGAWLLVDAVHYAPHFLINVAAFDVDFLLCSAYKFYGPHVGILYSRPGLLDQLEPDRLRTQDQEAPYRIETGTLNHAAIAGVKAAVEYVAGHGQGSTLRKKLASAIGKIHEHEFELAREIFEGLASIRGVKVVGPTFADPLRAPTVSFTVEGLTPEQVCRKLAAKGIFAWDGHFYAVRAMEVLGLQDKGGVTRVGILLYNTRDEVQQFLKEMRRIAERSS